MRGADLLVLSLVPNDAIEVRPAWPVLALLLEGGVEEGIPE